VLVVIARYQTRPGAGDEVASILAQHVSPTRAEPGCRSFLVNRSEDDPDRFVLYEQYEDEAAFQAHRTTLLAERTWERDRRVE